MLVARNLMNGVIPGRVEARTRNLGAYNIENSGYGPADHSGMTTH